MQFCLLLLNDTLIITTKAKFRQSDGEATLLSHRILNESWQGKF